MVATITTPVDKRFYAKVQKTSGCWEWTAAKNKDGYGVFGMPYGEGMKLAHRIAWRLHHGADAVGLVLHTCDNPSCVKISHLYDGTHAQNSNDAVARGRATGGRQGGGTLLTDDDVRSIRSSAKSHYELARQYGVSRRHIGDIAARKRRTGVI